MRIRILSGVISLVVIAFFGCNQKSDTENLEFERILTVKYLESVNLSDLIDGSIEYIPLGTSTNEYLGEINKIVKVKNNYLLLDSEISKKMYFFDENGTFIKSFGNVGSGPGEYGKLEDVLYLDEEVIVSDGSNFSILKYTSDGDFLSEKGLGLWVDQMILYNNHIVTLSPTNYSHNNFDSQDGILKVFSKDLSGVEFSFFPYEENHDDTGMKGLLFSDGKNNELSYIKPLRGEIFTLDAEFRIKPRFKIDFAEHNWPISMTEISSDQDRAEEVFRSNEVMSMSHRLMENENHVLFQAYMSSSEYMDKSAEREDKWLIIHPKGTGTCYAIHKVINDIDNGVFRFPISQDGSSFISVFTLDDFQNRSNAEGTINDKLTNIVDSLKYNSNPVLMKYLFKEKIVFKDEIE